MLKGGQGRETHTPLLYNGSVQAAGGGLTPTQICGTEKPETRGEHRKQTCFKTLLTKHTQTTNSNIVYLIKELLMYI